MRCPKILSRTFDPAHDIETLDRSDQDRANIETFFQKGNADHFFQRFSRTVCPHPDAVRKCYEAIGLYNHVSCLTIAKGDSYRLTSKQRKATAGGINLDMFSSSCSLAA